MAYRARSGQMFSGRRPRRPVARWLLGLGLTGGLIAPTPVGAVQLAGRTGLGYAQAIGGPDGLAIVFGAGNFVLEGILGFQYVSFGDASQSPETAFDLGIGTHFQVLRAEWAALTAGARFNLLTGVVDEGQGPVDVLQWGIDVPLRVYWFPLPNLSVHTELGVAFQIGADEGALTGGLSPKGFRTSVFNGPGAFGAIGLTFWWG